jgi:hypothetical protein
MNLTPEQQKVGKENFNEAVAVTRRDFLSGTVAAGLATGAGTRINLFRIWSKCW